MRIVAHNIYLASLTLLFPSLLFGQGFVGKITYKVVMQDSTGRQVVPYVADTLHQWISPKGVRTEYRGAARKPLAANAGTQLFLADSQTVYILDTVNGVIYQQPFVRFEVPGQKASEKWEAAQAGGEVLGRACQKRVAKLAIPMAGGNVFYTIWYSPSMQYPNKEALGEIFAEAQLQGAIPLKKRYQYQQIDLRVDITAIKITAMTESEMEEKGQFTLPANLPIRAFEPDVATERGYLGNP